VESGLVPNGKWIMREHCAMIRGMVPQDRLLEWAVEDGWEPLCKVCFRLRVERRPIADKISFWARRFRMRHSQIQIIQKLIKSESILL
jgi:hypothetical protein